MLVMSVALGGHYVNHIDNVEFVPLVYSSDKNNIFDDTMDTNENKSTHSEINEDFKTKKTQFMKVESKIITTMFDNFKLDKNFYFSYTYDITNTLQTNLLREKLKFVDRQDIHIPYNIDNNEKETLGYNNLFMWNLNLLQPILSQIDTTYDWFQPIIYGFVNQIDIPIVPNNTSNIVSICVIARRSRKFAGLRFLKRGANNEGNVANEVETEQIVFNSKTTSFHDKILENDMKFYGNDKYTSFVQHRGSIPLNWSQDLNMRFNDNGSLKEDENTNNNKARSNNTGKDKDQDKDKKLSLKTKPPIKFYLMDPYYRNAAKHFNDLFARYGGNKILVLDLLKQNTSKNKKKKNENKTTSSGSALNEDGEEDVLKGRESILGKEYRDCIDYLNQFLPEQNKIEYVGFDMSKVSKQNNNSGDNKVIDFLEAYASRVLSKVGIFHNNLYFKDLKVQEGVVRVSCQDCLDRTNASQFIIGKKALAEQLKQLKVLPEKYFEDNYNQEAFLEYDSLISNLFTNLYQEHGNTIALQYGSSHLVNTIATYRKDLKLKNGWRRESSNNLRDLMESFKRYYNNSFYDAGRQEAINIFLGVWKYNPHRPLLWDMKTDYYLHNNHEITKEDIFNTNERKKSYRLWFNFEFLVPISTLIKTEILDKDNDINLKKYLSKIKDFPKFVDSYWSTHYDLGRYTDLSNMMEFNLFLDNWIDLNGNMDIISSKDETLNQLDSSLEIFDSKESTTNRISTSGNAKTLMSVTNAKYLKKKKLLEIIEESYLKQGLFEGDKKIGRRYYKNKSAQTIAKSRNCSQVYDTNLAEDFDVQFEEKEETYVDRLSFFKKVDILDDEQELLYTNDYTNNDSRYDVYDVFENAEKNIGMDHEDLYSKDVEIHVDASLYEE